MRAVDRDLIRGGHYGQRSCEPHEHMAAPISPANVKTLANSEPSHGTKRTYRDVFYLSAFAGKADINHDRIAERAVGLVHGCKALFILKPEVTTLAGSRWLLPRRSVPCGSCASIEPFEYAGSTTALRDRIFAATHRLADLEAFELRMVEVERLVLPGVPMGKTECFRLGPGFERRLALPHCV